MNYDDDEKALKKITLVLEKKNARLQTNHQFLLSQNVLEFFQLPVGDRRSDISRAWRDNVQEKLLTLEADY